MKLFLSYAETKETHFEEKCKKKLLTFFWLNTIRSFFSGRMQYAVFNKVWCNLKECVRLATCKWFFGGQTLEDMSEKTS